ncbi:MAG TPA: orotidine-5'-phosphate decarboxylase [Gemmatimonadaceae bacterium]|jgi:orotidine-5'-phosphate decarboxylase|nr:orotidine-5'-phosphate decarboxylase [Gemmatimonadaceae bacterium]
MSITPIVALDVSSTTEALRLVEVLGDSSRFYKVGNELFTAEGPDVVRRLRAGAADVFLDLKFHDIPNTVAGGVRSAARLGARLVTVHATGGEAMVRAAVEAGGSACGVLAVTILTSLSSEAIAAAWGRHRVDVTSEVLRLAGLAARAGAHGVVCSGAEAAAVRAEFGDALAVLVPGVRPAGAPTQDQARVVTPRAAAECGARYVVVGRMVTAATDPRAAMEAVGRELA